MLAIYKMLVSLSNVWQEIDTQMKSHETIGEMKSQKYGLFG